MSHCDSTILQPSEYSSSLHKRTETTFMVCFSYELCCCCKLLLCFYTSLANSVARIFRLMPRNKWKQSNRIELLIMPVKGSTLAFQYHAPTTSIFHISICIINVCIFIKLYWIVIMVIVAKYNIPFFSRDIFGNFLLLDLMI